MLKLGLTGGIGSGKSYVANCLTQHFGIPVYDCDTEAKRLNQQSPEIRRGLTSLMGDKAYLPDGTLNKAFVASWLFASEHNAQFVNAIVHPVVKEDWSRWLCAQSTPIVAMESAILYESGFNRLVDKVVFVDAPFELRLKRAMARDNASKEQIEARMARQQTACAKSMADFVIMNDGRGVTEEIKKLMNLLDR